MIVLVEVRYLHTVVLTTARLYRHLYLKSNAVRSDRKKKQILYKKYKNGKEGRFIK